MSRSLSATVSYSQNGIAGVFFGSLEPEGMMALKVGSRVRSKVFTARLRGVVQSLVETPEAHSFYGQSFALVRHDHGLIMWTPTSYLSPPPKDAYEAFHKTPAAGWEEVTAAPERLLELLAAVHSPYSHIRSDHRLAGLFDDLELQEATNRMLAALEPVCALPDLATRTLPAPAKPFTKSDYKGFQEVKARDLVLDLIGGWRFVLADRLQGRGDVAEALDDASRSGLLALDAALGSTLIEYVLSSPIHPLGVSNYGGNPSFDYARDCGLDVTWPLCGGTGY
jgi:hypothetical protein